MLCFPSYFQRLLRQPKTLQHKASIVREAWGARWGSGVSHYLDAAAVQPFCLSFSLCTLSPQQNISLGRSCNKIPAHTPNPLCLWNHPSPPFPLSSLKSLHSSRQLSSGKRLAFRGRGSGAALMRLRCRVLCACVCICGKGGLRGALGQETAPSR